MTEDPRPVRPRAVEERMEGGDPGKGAGRLVRPFLPGALMVVATAVGLFCSET